jgi:3' terminal RNA ribose 2'-O-methyltransferase Hen1
VQLEITLTKPPDAEWSARDLGFLLHKHPDHLHTREVASGTAHIFFPESGEESTTAVLFLDVDPVGLVRGRSEHADGLLTQYVNDRPYAASSFLSVALARSFGQSLAGKSKDRQELAERPLPFEARVLPLSISNELARTLFEPLGYAVSFEADRSHGTLKIAGSKLLRELLSHLYVLIPVLDNDKHYYIGEDEVEKLLAKGEGWLAAHPEKELIARRALKHRRSLAALALARLAEDTPEPDEEDQPPRDAAEVALEKPIRLHDLRLDTVATLLAEEGVNSVLDLGCGEGKLIKRLLKERTISRIVGVDSVMDVLQRCSAKLRLDGGNPRLRARVSLMQGSLTYADRRWAGFDAATLVEVIEHIDLARLSALEKSLFGVARPSLVVITTPNREYNVLFEGMPPEKFRHPDHRFEWTRAELARWAERIASVYGYGVELKPLGPEHEIHGGPSQLAIFWRAA